jgi:hydroxyethylthiazole kinase-like uncharacterized protein yjeF
MIPILTPEQVKKADLTAIEEYSIPSIVLMENAARSSAKIIKNIIEENNLNIFKIAIICGSGNNGGDGFALARHLFELFNITVFWTGSESKMSEETKINFKSIVKLGLEIIKLDNSEDILNIDHTYDAIIDSMIGIGGSEDIKGITYEIIQYLSSFECLKIAIDVPTGLNSLTGFANEYCFNADYTITMFAEKSGLKLNSGIEKSGIIKVAYLGAPSFIANELAEIHSLEPEDLEGLFPKRINKSTKFDYGKALIIGGTAKYPGAPSLTANACLRSGAGLTYIYSPQIHNSLNPEVIVLSNDYNLGKYLNLVDLNNLKENINNFSSIAIGPGLGDRQETILFVRELLNIIDEKIPVILDADGLRAIDINAKYRKNIILTPHFGEFSRMTGINRNVIEHNSNNLATEWANKLNCTILLKGIPSIITDGISTFWNIYGNPALAKGGSGDVLTGILVALFARNNEFNPAITTAAGCLIHSLAADNYILDNSEESMTASDIIGILPKILP